MLQNFKVIAFIASDLLRENQQEGTCFVKNHKVSKVIIWWMIKCDFKNRLFVWNFHNEIMCII